MKKVGFLLFSVVFGFANLEWEAARAGDEVPGELNPAPEDLSVHQGDAAQPDEIPGELDPMPEKKEPSGMSIGIPTDFDKISMNFDLKMQTNWVKAEEGLYKMSGFEIQSGEVGTYIDGDLLIKLVGGPALNLLITGLPLNNELNELLDHFAIVVEADGVKYNSSLFSQKGKNPNKKTPFDNLYFDTVKCGDASSESSTATPSGVEELQDTENPNPSSQMKSRICDNIEEMFLDLRTGTNVDTVPGSIEEEIAMTLDFLLFALAHEIEKDFSMRLQSEFLLEASAHCKKKENHPDQIVCAESLNLDMVGHKLAQPKQGSVLVPIQ